LVKRYAIEQVIIAMPAAPGKKIRTIVDMCDRLEVPAKTMPGIYELLDDKVRVSQLRPVQIEDLLRRDPVKTDIAAVQKLVEGKCVLITGAGGAIGREICRQIMRCHPAQLVLVGHGENSIFAIHNELKKANAEVSLHPIIADLRFPHRLQAIFRRYKPDMVFHAAAHKHVPLMEDNPGEAITNNVQGTRNLINVSLEMGVQNFVMISSDKAVNSTNVMGASKRVAEMLVHQAAQRSGRAFVSVRFGNVLGSRGSVVLTFKEQIAAGGPLTVTHPEMTRYFMTIPEAVQLVLQAAVLGRGGEVFVLDMGDPVKIVDLARDMIELSGLQEGLDIDIAYTGLRPGEKMYEELFVVGERHQPTIHPKIRVAVRTDEHTYGEHRVMNGNGAMPTDLDRGVDALLLAAYHDDEQAIVNLLQEINPLYCPVQQQEHAREVGKSPRTHEEMAGHAGEVSGARMRFVGGKA
jgi:FlaA1/EpsC-like NDP-sugar epimerase